MATTEEIKKSLVEWREKATICRNPNALLQDRSRCARYLTDACGLIEMLLAGSAPYDKPTDKPVPAPSVATRDTRRDIEARVARWRRVALGRSCNLSGCEAMKLNMCDLITSLLAELARVEPCPRCGVGSVRIVKEAKRG